jgi:hypothetical protein
LYRFAISPSLTVRGNVLYDELIRAYPVWD